MRLRRYLVKKSSDGWIFILTIYLQVLRVILFCVDVVFLFFRPRLLASYLRIIWLDARRSPFRSHHFERVFSARQHGMSRSELTYGFTPLVTALFLFWRSKLNRDGILYDLGAGRGRVLLAGKYFGARVVGVDVDASHIALAEQALQGIDVQCRCIDAKKVDLSDATHVYLAWTTWSLQSRRQIKERLLLLKKGARVITVTWPIVIPELMLTHQSTPLFSWGFSPIWIYERR